MGVGAVSVVRVVGVGVVSAVTRTVWVMVGAEGTLTLCVVPTVLAEMVEEKADAAGELEARGGGEFPVLKGTAVTLLVVWVVYTRVVTVSPLVVLDEMESVGDRLGTVRVAVCDAVVKGTVKSMDEEVRTVSVMVGRPELCEDGIVCVLVSTVPVLAGGKEMSVMDKLTVGRVFKEVRLGVL